MSDVNGSGCQCINQEEEERLLNFQLTQKLKFKSMGKSKYNIISFNTPLHLWVWDIKKFQQLKINIYWGENSEY